jgi:hypothetical protein
METAQIDPPVLNEFKRYVSNSLHVPRNIIPYLIRSPFMADKPLHTGSLRALLELHAVSIEGLVTGHQLNELVSTRYNPTQVIEYCFHEKYGRPCEALMSAWMKEYVESGLAAKAELLFVEPDPTYTRVVSVWRGWVYPIATGNAPAKRDLSVQELRSPDTVEAKKELTEYSSRLDKALEAHLGDLLGEEGEKCKDEIKNYYLYLWRRQKGYQPTPVELNVKLSAEMVYNEESDLDFATNLINKVDGSAHYLTSRDGVSIPDAWCVEETSP